MAMAFLCSVVSLIFVVMLVRIVYWSFGWFGAAILKILVVWFMLLVAL